MRGSRRCEAILLNLKRPLHKPTIVTRAVPVSRGGRSEIPVVSIWQIGFGAGNNCVQKESGIREGPLLAVLATTLLTRNIWQITWLIFMKNNGRISAQVTARWKTISPAA